MHVDDLLIRPLKPGLLALLALCIACGPSIPIATTSPILPSAEAAPAEQNEWTSEIELTRAMNFRRAAGLRSDRLWTRFVATSPDTQPGIRAFSVPLMPDELLTLQGRARTMDAIMPVVESYGTGHPNDWAGAYVDNVHGRAVALFVDRIEEHEDAVRRLLHPNAPLDVLDATWTLQELVAMQRAITRQIPWLRDHSFYFLGAGVDLRANVAFLEVSSGDPDAERILLEHFEGFGKLIVKSDGTGARLLPTGTLRGTVTDEEGQPIAGLLVELEGDIPGTGNTGDIGHATGPAGQFLFTDIAAIAYDIVLYEEVGDARVLKGSDRAVVRVGKITEVTIIVDVD